MSNVSNVTTTPNGVIIMAHNPPRPGVNVTEAVSAIYDMVIQSLDWGSGFFTSEDAVPMAELGRICGFEMVEEAERYLKRAKELEDKR